MSSNGAAQSDEDLPFLGMEIDWLWAGPDNPVMSSRHPVPRCRNIATHRIEGVKFSGKSALGENISSNYRATGSVVYDFFGANDNEALAALESPFKKDVVLVHGDNVKIECGFETIPFGKLNPWTTPDGKWYVTCKKFFTSEYEMYAALSRFTDLIRDRDSWNRVDVIFIREAQEWLASKTETNQAESKKEAQDAFIKFHNQTVHSGFALVLDSQRDVEVAKNLRELSTFTYYKKLGGMEIPKKLYWIMSPDRANFSLDALRDLEPDQFLIVTDDNAVGAGSFEYPPWHINRGSGLLSKLGIRPYRVENGQEIEITVSKPMPSRRKKSSSNSRYTPVAARGLTDQRIVVTDFWANRIKALKESGLDHHPGKMLEQLHSEGFTGKRRTLEAQLKELRRNEQGQSEAS